MIKKLCSIFLLGSSIIASHDLKVNNASPLAQHIPVNSLQSIIAGYLNIHDVPHLNKTYIESITAHVSPNGEYLTISRHIGESSNAILLYSNTQYNINAELYAFDWSPDNQFLLAQNDNHIFVIDMLSKQHKFTLSHKTSNLAYAISPDSKFIATTSHALAPTGNYYIQIWNLSSGKLVKTIYIKDFIFSLKYSPNGDQLYVIANNYQLIDNTGDKRHSFKKIDIHTSEERLIQSVTFIAEDCKYSPSTKYIIFAGVGEGNRIIKVLNLITEKSHDIKTMNEVLDATFSPDDKSILVAHGTTLANYDLETGKLLNYIIVPANSKPLITGCAYSANGQFIAYNDDRIIKICDAKSFELIISHECDQRVKKIMFTSNGRYVIAQTESTFKIWSNQAFEIEPKAQLKKPGIVITQE
jgi:WD40 repeat protein